MKFILLPKPIDNVESVFPELDSELIYTNILQGINISVFQQLQVMMLMVWVIELSKSPIPHQQTFMHFTEKL